MDHSNTTPRWSDKITAIISAANCFGGIALRHVNHCLEIGREHMEYKDFTEFDCDCEEQYIFQQAEHLIEKYRLPFSMALNTTVHDRLEAEWMQKEIALEKLSEDKKPGDRK